MGRRIRRHEIELTHSWGRETPMKHLDFYKALPASISFAVLTIIWISVRLPSPAGILMDADDGHQLAGAIQILHGEHPFVNFDATYGPFTFYASALAQSIFGNRVIGEIILVVVGYAIAYALLFHLTYRATNNLWLSFAFNVLALAAIPRLYKYYIVLGPVITLLAAWYYIEEPKRRNLVWLAFAIVLAGLFRSDFGVYCTIAGTVAVASRSSDKREGLWRATILWAEIFIFALPYLLFLALHGGLIVYFRDMLVGGPEIAAGMSLPFPIYQARQPIFSATNLIVYATVLSFCLPFVVFLFLATRWKSLEDTEKKFILTATVLYSFSLLQASHRADYLHLLQAIPLAFLLLAWLMRKLWSKPIRSLPEKKLGSVFSLLLSPFLLCLTALPVFLVNQSGWTGIDVSSISSKLGQYSLPKTQMLANVGPDSWYVDTMQYIRRCTNDRQRLMALPALTTFYYYTDRMFGGGQIGIVSGYFVLQTDQERIVSKMSQQDIPLIVYLPNGWSDNLEARTFEEVAPLVSNFIDKNYTEVMQTGPALLLLRRDLKLETRSDTLVGLSCPIPR